ncbi:helix-turn-helix domain-containing protein, partial [Neisseria sp. P0013.S004]|uniref:helix-turn-helix domain-containing protein n=1 Tax=Neisseria sp. P0013.S004 TaxID=3436740 RepID=UPI003F823FBB
MNCTPKVGHPPLQLTRCSFFYEQIYITLQIPSRTPLPSHTQPTAYADHYGISRTHLRRWIRAYQEGGIGALEHPQSKTMPQHRKNPFIADKPDHEKTQAELIEELCYMRA